MWAEFIDNIIQKEVGLKATTHEPCLYHGIIDGQRVLLQRQVDDFAVASTNTETCHKVIDHISKFLTAPMKKLGLIDEFNGVQVQQHQHFIKLHNNKYIKQILNNHDWLHDTFKSHAKPTPMRSDNKYLEELENAVGPASEQDRKELEMKMKFKYRAALGEALYAMVTCRPDILIPVMKLSKYANNPAEIHYVALKNVFRYLHSTMEKGITYWRKHQSNHQNLDTTPTDHIPQINHPFLEYEPSRAVGGADSDWAGDTKHRKSVSGMTIMYGGAVIAYKSKFQRTIAQSSTEAEFATACDAAKLILKFKYLKTTQRFFSKITMERS